jgi:hypothetical protein
MRYLLLFLLYFTQSSFAENFPAWDVYWMCANADAIILGEQLQDDSVKVTKWIRGATASAPSTIVITDIHKLSKSLGAFWLRAYKKQPVKTLTTRRFVAFLEHNGGGWQSMDPLEDSGLCGSCAWFGSRMAFATATSKPTIRARMIFMKQKTQGPKTNCLRLSKRDCAMLRNGKKH